MLYTLYVGFVSVFIALATVGHVLLLIAIYPNIFGNPSPAQDGASSPSKTTSAGTADQTAATRAASRLAA